MYKITNFKSKCVHTCLIFFLFFFIFSCTKSDRSSISFRNQLTEEEKADLEYFLNFLLFENHGAFVLFGSKPIAEMPLFDSVELERQEQAYVKSLTNEEQTDRKKMIDEGLAQDFQFKRNPYDGWKAFQKLNKSAQESRFKLIKWLDKENPACSQIFLVNIEQTALCLEENYLIFKEINGGDFHPLEMALNFEIPHHPFWEKIIFRRKHLAMGLLFGYGKKNALFYQWKTEKQSEKTQEYLSKRPKIASTHKLNFGEGNVQTFTIPLFGCEKNDEYIEKYTHEKKSLKSFIRQMILSK